MVSNEFRQPGLVAPRQDMNRRRDGISARGKLLGIQCDVADETSASSAISKAWSTLDGLDIVIHAAGIITPARIEDLSPRLWRQHIDINLSGAFYVMRDCGLRMRQQGSGSIVAIGSDLSFNGLECYAHYCASKAGLANQGART
ncbi:MULTISPECIES: SDR family oxidoreductase [unclassified Mesorhizobium]|uniref:SDR family NAD(P)-dependent oxidoreductase n=1 Tax=unclassified Mesorhizobium TaxID=325217 RepID=UPI0024157ADD|nr:MULTISPECIES: SDR family oxidoreductase [unclassified Mesorhizobium]MDG4889952.1 SDR family NAD(P)-dependent oxidoreductase [Mesorhizobium sp. WSM4887]MDG4904095.1 SDR family NAD(P)-dependent oxidoreductase [Mesorhizobium sp. WSM4962]MDG4909122.1 SDR family NAD(P)-dependent oxidoreductase [Mesorhizobium sp. WSM4898]MDG4921746.1 SDR family NAD(P)-dependent oxidoreductase [Mesorhizobium sp. WSM4989]